MTGWKSIRDAKVPADQEAATAAGRAALAAALELAELRSARGVTQVELARRLGRRQGSVSELERRDDGFVSSLREYVEALGGRLEVSAVFDGEPPVPLAIAN